MNAEQIIARWEELCAAGDDPTLSDVEWRRRIETLYAFMTKTPRHTRIIREEYARQFPDGPPPRTPGMTDDQRLRIAGYIRQWN